MKVQFSSLILISVIVLGLIGCQTNQAAETETQSTNRPAEVENDSVQQPGQDTTRPGQSEIDDEAYPVQDLPRSQYETAYPIAEEDLQLLLQTWALTTYTENNIHIEAENKTLTFNIDGTYELTAENGSSSGNWTASLLAYQSTLILNPGTDKILAFDIIELNGSHLHLHFNQDGVQINEYYRPAD